MDRNSNSYTFIYAIVMVTIVAVVLSITAITLKPFQSKNVEIEKKQNILKSVKIIADVDQAEEIYESTVVKSIVVKSDGSVVESEDAFKLDLKREHAKAKEDRLMPIYIATVDGKTKYIIPLYGKGLWGPVWGFVSLDADLNTVYGIIFDHASETPGLGAKIVTDNFQDAFIGKTIMDGSEFFGVKIVKKGVSVVAEHKVDAISGATITGTGVQEMIYNDLELYMSYFKSIK